jgi:dipeptidyl aminopeptidase/acylaminoacyl peptidase
MATAALRTMPATTWIHGDDDRNVPFQQTTDLVEKLRAQKVAIEELILPRRNSRPAPLERLGAVLQSNG